MYMNTSNIISKTFSDSLIRINEAVVRCSWAILQPPWFLYPGSVLYVLAEKRMINIPTAWVDSTQVQWLSFHKAWIGSAI